VKLTSPKKTHLGLQKQGKGNGFVLDDDEPVSEFEDRKAFLDYHFVKWLLVEFAKDETTGKAKLHVLKAQDVWVEWQGHYYAGIRFRMPEW
jgi:hypothetical protein